MKVVIVDDEKIILDGIKRTILKVYPNFEVNCFINPNDAIDFINIIAKTVPIIVVCMVRSENVEIICSPPLWGRLGSSDSLSAGSFVALNHPQLSIVSPLRGLFCAISYSTYRTRPLRYSPSGW